MNFGRDVLDLIHERLTNIELQLTRLTTMIDVVSRHQTVQAAYSIEDFARIVGKAAYTVREWCRQGRIKAEKRSCGRGNSQEWSIPHAELERYRNDGLLPPGNIHPRV